MENQQGLRKPLAERRAESLDKSQIPRSDSESCNCRCLSLTTGSSRRSLRQTASDRARCTESPAQSAEDQVTQEATLALGEAREFLPSEQRPPQDIKKDKAQRWAQQGWLKTLLNFFLRTGPEEPKEKGSRRPKGREGLPQPTEPPEAPGEPALGKKAHDKKACCNKHGHKKHVAKETKGAGGQVTAAALCLAEDDPGPAHRGGERSDYQAFLIEGDGAGVSDVSPQATGHQQEEELKKPDEDAIIQMIVELLKKEGDEWEEKQLQALQTEGAPQNPAPASRKKSQEKKSSLKRAFSLKKHGSEESKRVGAADVSSPETRLPRRPNFLPLCVGGHRPSISNSLDLEEAEGQETLSIDGGSPSPSELPTQAGSRGPEEELQPDIVSESKEFIQKIIALLRDPEEQWGEKQPQVQEEEVAVEKQSSPCRRKNQQKKSSLKRAFSRKKYGSKEPKTVGAAGVASPDTPPSRRPTFLPLCVGGHQAFISCNPDGLKFQEPSPAEARPVGFSEAPSWARSRKPEGGPQPDGACESKELLIQRLVALLQEVDGQLGTQIRRHPSYKRFFYTFSDSSLKKLTAILRSQEAHSPALGRNLVKRPYEFDFMLANKFAGSDSLAICTLMGLRDHYSYTQFSCREPQPNITSPESQSPD
ncbi:protein BNIP5 [Cynocephalus volans]|uniref:protein BNIP5 n=1 Tax=Cynocephalus volans TaxID=110931 RepID=UPI002FC76A08